MHRVFGSDDHVDAEVLNPDSNEFLTVGIVRLTKMCLQAMAHQIPKSSDDVDITFPCPVPSTAYVTVTKHQELIGKPARQTIGRRMQASYRNFAATIGLKIDDQKFYDYHGSFEDMDQALIHLPQVYVVIQAPFISFNESDLTFLWIETSKLLADNVLSLIPDTSVQALYCLQVLQRLLTCSASF